MFGLSLAAIVLVSALFAIPTRSFADTYQLEGLSTDAGVSFYGLTNSGQAVLTESYGYCDGQYTTCYGLPGDWSDVAPTLSFDDGTPCAPSSLPSGISYVEAVCNNGRGAYYGYFPKSSSDDLFAFAGSNPPQSIYSPALTGGLAMNSLGDIVFDDGFGDIWVEAIDLTTLTPEPASILLLATGVLALAAFTTLRRRPVFQP
jgi:hypothetical protein